VLWNIVTILLVVVALVVMVGLFPGTIGKRVAFGLIRLPPVRKPEREREPHEPAAADEADRGLDRPGSRRS
jgi:hypothetical protein